MSADRETIDVYNAKSRDYADMTQAESASDELTAFIALLPEKARVLDLGCGPGHSAIRMIKSGAVVDAVDASPEMVKLAHKVQVPARIGRFSDIEGTHVYDAIWASFSLLHAPRADFSGLLETLAKSLEPGGCFYIGMKTGEGEIRDSLGRFYCLYTEEELLGHLRAKGFTDFKIRTGSGQGLDGKTAPFVTITCRKSVDV